MTTPLLVRRLSPLAVAAALPAAAGAAAFVADPDAARAAARVPVRLARSVAAAVAIAADYKRTAAATAGEAPEAAAAALRAAHARGAARLRDLCHANGGIYVKLGQHVATLDHLLPAEYVDTMRATMLNACPPSSFDSVAATVGEELGVPLASAFRAFDRAPVAAASLAQVHRAVAMDGTPVAVKVQHRGLREACAADVATVAGLVAAAKLLFPTFDLSWLVAEVRANLPKELDFRLEAANAARCAANLASPPSSTRGRVVVPAPHAPTPPTPRLLVMEWVDGVPVSDAAGLAERGLAARDVATLVATAFSEMVFLHGFVHADPHAGNLLVRRGGDGRAQLVLLDHGLYRELDPAFRVAYARLWDALLAGDVDAILSSARAMHADDAAPLFASMLTLKPWRAISGAGGTAGKGVARLASEAGDAAEAREYAADHAADINALLGRLPRELLLLLKTNDCLRSIDRSLGEPTNTFVVTAAVVARALAAEPGVAPRGWRRAARARAAVAAARAAGWARRWTAGKGGAGAAAAAHG